MDIAGWMEAHGVTPQAVLGTIGVIVLGSVAAVTAGRLARRALAQVQPHLRLSYETVLILSRVLAGALWVCLGLLILNVWGVSVSGLWTFLVSTATIVGVGFLAVWTIVSNVTASLFLAIWRPFHLGDAVELLPENLKGRVVDRNMMFTALREENGAVLQIPNNLFFQKMFRVEANSDRFPFEML